MTKTAELSLITVEPDTGRVWATFTLRDAEPGRSDIVTTHGPRAFEPDDDVAGILAGINADLTANHGCAPLPDTDMARIRAGCDVAHKPELVAAVRSVKAEKARLADEERARREQEEATAKARAVEQAETAQKMFDDAVAAAVEKALAARSEVAVDAKL